MRTLDEAWSWYDKTRELIRSMRRLADKHWTAMPESVWKDDRFKALDSVDITENADAVLEEFDDIGVFVIFSVFEAILRDRVLATMTLESASITHPALSHAVRKATENVEEGSLYNNVLSIWKAKYHNEVELVNQVRHYRNWVAHGRREGRKPAAVDPATAVERLKQFLEIISEYNLSSDAEVSGNNPAAEGEATPLPA